MNNTNTSTFRTGKIIRMVCILWNQIKRYRIIIYVVLMNIVGFLLICIIQEYPEPYQGPLDNITCHYIETNDTLPRADSASFVPPPRSIFFHETSCKGDLNPRQACAVESTARAHPKWQINVLFVAPVTRSALNTGSLAALRNYSNVNLFRLHVVKYARGTPLENLIAGGALNRTIFRIIHTADMLRYLTLYKFGGIYFDLDVVVVKPVDSLAKNWAALATYEELGAGALAFSRDALGRSVAKATMMDLQLNYRGEYWNHNSVGVISRVLNQECWTKSLANMSAATCNGFEVYGPQYFYPVEYWNADSYFTPGKIEEEATAYVHHIWNKLTSGLDINKYSPYAKLARRHCPNIHKLHVKHFGG